MGNVDKYNWCMSTFAFHFFKMCHLDISDKEFRQNVQVFNMLCILVQYAMVKFM